MKLLTTNFLTCAIKSCKTNPASYPLHFRDAELLQNEVEIQPEFIKNIVPRLDWAAFTITADEVVFFFQSYSRTFLSWSLSNREEAASLENRSTGDN
jgi:hypothetical protein